MRRCMGQVMVTCVLLVAACMAPLTVSAAPGTPARVVGAPGGLRLRADPSLGAPIVRTLYNGQTVYIVSGPLWSEGVYWSYVKVYHGAFYSLGYCASAYLSTYPGYVPSGEHGLMVTASALRLRYGPGLWYGTWRVVPYGTIVQPMGSSQWAGGILWTKVGIDGGQVWAAAVYLRPV